MDGYDFFDLTYANGLYVGVATVGLNESMLLDRLETNQPGSGRSTPKAFEPTSGTALQRDGIASADVASVLAAAPAAPDVQPEGDLEGSLLADVFAELVEVFQPVRGGADNSESVFVDVFMAFGA